jgi:chromosome segregation ATPase
MNHLLSDKKRIQRRILESVHVMQKRITQKEQIIANCTDNLQQEIAKTSDIEAVFKAAKAERDAAQDELNAAKRHFAQLRNDFFRLFYESIRMESENAAQTRMISIMHRKQTMVRNEYFQEKHEQATAGGQLCGVENEIIGANAIAHKLRMSVEQLRREITSYADRTLLSLKVIEKFRKKPTHNFFKSSRPNKIRLPRLSPNPTHFSANATSYPPNFAQCRRSVSASGRRTKN